MEKRPLIVADELSLKILAFLHEHPSESFTTQELAAERSIFKSPDKVQEKISALLRKGLLKVIVRGRETTYQIIRRKSSSPA